MRHPSRSKKKEEDLSTFPKTSLMIFGSEKSCLYNYILWTKSIWFACKKTGLGCYISLFSFLLHAQTTSANRGQYLDRFTGPKIATFEDRAASKRIESAKNI